MTGDPRQCDPTGGMGDGSPEKQGEWVTGRFFVLLDRSSERLKPVFCSLISLDVGGIGDGSRQLKCCRVLQKSQFFQLYPSILLLTF